MKKTILGVAKVVGICIIVVVVFCIIWVYTAGKARQAAQEAEQKYKQAEQEYKAEQAYETAQAYKAEQAYKTAQAYKAEQAYKTAHANKQAEQEYYAQAYKTALAYKAEQAYKTAQAYKPVQAYEQLFSEPSLSERISERKQASIRADAHYRTQALWGIGYGLMGALFALSKLTAKA